MNRTRRVCPTCKTSKFKASSDGGLVCKYGHKLLGIQEEASEEAIGGSGGRARKKIKILTNDNHLHNTTPAQQKSDFLIIIQYTLQVVSRCMIQDLNFPPELELALRELWLLYVADAKRELAESYIYEANEMERDDKMGGSQKRKMSLDTFFKEEEEALDKQLLSDEEDESEDDLATQEIGKVKSTRLKWPVLGFSDTLGFIYLTCLYLNYPVMPADLVRWCKTDQIPYLHIQERIPSHFLERISLVITNQMTHIPTSEVVTRRASEFSKRLKVNCGLEFPVYNVPLYLDRFCSQYFLPVEAYYYAEKTFELYKSRHLPCLNIADAPRDKAPITTILMACVIASAKLIYGTTKGGKDSQDANMFSEFNLNISKQDWLERINKNVAKWKKINDADDLDSIITYIRDTSYAQNATSRAGDKLTVVSRFLNGFKVPASSSTLTNYKTVSTKRRYELFMDNDSNSNTVGEVSGGATKVEESNEQIRQGEFYYRKANEFSVPPQDILPLLELGCLVCGETGSRQLENTLKIVDKDISATCTDKKPITKAQYKKFFLEK